MRFAAGFFANLNSAIWFGLNLKQQLSAEEREHKTHSAKRDTFDEMLDSAPEHLHATAVRGQTQNGPTFIVKNRAWRAADKVRPTTRGAPLIPTIPTFHAWSGDIS